MIVFLLCFPQSLNFLESLEHGLYVFFVPPFSVKELPPFDRLISAKNRPRFDSNSTENRQNLS